MRFLYIFKTFRVWFHLYSLFPFIGMIMFLSYIYFSFNLSLGSKPVGVNCIAIEFSRSHDLIPFTVVLSAPHQQPSFCVSGLGTGTGTIFGSCDEVSRCA